MKPDQPTRPGANGHHPDQGEGDRVSVRHYNQQVREFVAGHQVESAARAERKARSGPRPTRVSLDELVEMGRTVIDRVRPYVERGVGKLRARFQRK